jgi:hypothetical protein
LGRILSRRESATSLAQLGHLGDLKQLLGQQIFGSNFAGGFAYF